MQHRGEFERFIDDPTAMELVEVIDSRTSHLSFFEYEDHDEFWRVVDMGEEALPELFEALTDDESNGWICFFAIGKIVDDLRMPRIPMPDGAIGEYTMDYNLIRQAFLDYGYEHDLVVRDEEGQTAEI